MDSLNVYSAGKLMQKEKKMSITPSVAVIICLFYLNLHSPIKKTLTKLNRYIITCICVEIKKYGSLSRMEKFEGV